MAFQSKLYGPMFLSLGNGEINFNTHTFKAMLCTSSYAPNQDTHRYKADVTNEIAGGGSTGYTTGGQTLTGVTVAYNAATNLYSVDFNDPSWPNSNITARFMVVYDDTPATNKPLVCYWDFDEDKISASGNFTGTLSGSGLVNITAA
ncbi:hypothetical protein [Gordonia terrae]|uniref:hypothetical protein n=1 Tax=Gordonia terrae TaxID=2055 RepID=UPI003F6D4E67